MVVNVLLGSVQTVAILLPVSSSFQLLIRHKLDCRLICLKSVVLVLHLVDLYFCIRSIVKTDVLLPGNKSAA